MARVGGKRAGAGRPKGAKNKATLENKASIEQLARAHTPVAIAALVRIVKSKVLPPAAIVSAAVALLDRGYGKPRQAVEHSGPDEGPIIMGIEFVGGDPNEYLNPEDETSE